MKCCPFRKEVNYTNQNWVSGTAIVHTEEDFLECIGDRCAAYESYPLSKQGNCKLCNTTIVPAQCEYINTLI